MTTLDRDQAEKFNYFIDRTDDRLLHMEEKIDRLLQFQSKVLGITLAVSGVVTVIVNVALIFIEAKI